MSRDTKKQILWVRFKPEQDYVKKVRVRAGVKRPPGLSVREFCPGIALDRKKVLNEALKTRKTTRKELRWRIDIKNDDFVVFTKYDNEAQWSQEDIDNFGDIPGIKWTSNKRPRSSPGDQPGGGPPQPQGGLSPQGEGAAGGTDVAAPQGIPGLTAAAGVGTVPRVPSLANLFEKK